MRPKIRKPKQPFWLVARQKGAFHPSIVHTATTKIVPTPCAKHITVWRRFVIVPSDFDGAQKSTHHFQNFKRPYLVHAVAPTGCSKAHVVAPAGVRTARSLAI